jgi:hypothetical protein
MTAIYPNTTTSSREVLSMTKLPCGGDIHCRRHSMSLAEFKVLCGEEGRANFNSAVGKAATKLYKQTYGEAPPVARCKIAGNVVTMYPCGIIEYAYKQVGSGKVATDEQQK